MGEPSGGISNERAAPEARRRRRRHRSGSSGLWVAPIRSEINVTPLVDVVLVLLIIFMVVTPMLSRGVKVHLPETVHHEKRQDTGEQVVVCVDEHGKVFVGAEPAEGEQFFVKLKRELGAGREVHVKADRKLEYGTVRAVLEKIHAAGAGKVSLGTDEKKREQ